MISLFAGSEREAKHHQRINPGNTREENARSNLDEIPQGCSDANLRQVVQARWTIKHVRPITPTICTPTQIGAEVHSWARGEHGERARSDSAYAHKARRTELRRQGYRAKIQHNGQADEPLSPAWQRRKHRIARDRAFGEYRLPDSASRVASVCARLTWRGCSTRALCRHKRQRRLAGRIRV